jgi:tetratricopeptide (TPR) repeat protein
MQRRICLTGICLFITFFSIAQAPKKAVAFYNAGLEHAAKGAFPDAIVSFKKAISLYKKYDVAYFDLGNAYYKSNKVDSALLSYRQALNINPKRADVHMLIGNIYRDVKKQSDDAITSYMNAIKAGDNSKEVYYSLAWCYNDKKEYDKAISYAIKALEIDNAYRQAYNEVAHAYRNSKKYDEAIAQFKKNMAISTVDLPYYYSGLCYIELKDKAGALNMQEELQKINASLAAALKRRIDAATF